MIEPITVINILQKEPIDLANYVNSSILSVRVPIYSPNHQVSIHYDIMPLLSAYANFKGYITELYNIVISAYYQQKKFKKDKDERFVESYFIDTETKKEILYRANQAVDRYYEAASRLMTGIGQPDSNMNRH